MICSNRAELLALECQEERDHFLRAALMALGIATLGLLAGIAISAAIVLALWLTSPLGVLVALGGIYALAALAPSRPSAVSHK
ncbi:MAG: phage holin family protein [Planctomycetota bacterium]|nr:phage holin family protein [Planctomycetota bacterium]